MGDAHTNTTALLAKTMPRFPPPGRAGEGQIHFRHAPKPHIYLHPQGDTNEPQRNAHEELCKARGWPAQELHVLGEPLPPEKCDVVLVMSAVWVDVETLRPNQQPRAGRHIIPGELARVDMAEFLKRAEASLPADQRIVRPGLQVVKG